MEPNPIKLTVPTGAEIRAIRERRGLSQTQFGVMLGVSRNAVGAWEREEYAPLLHKAELLELKRQTEKGDSK